MTADPFSSFPPELRRAFIGQIKIGQLVRLTPELFCFRFGSGEGNWSWGTLEELLPLFNQMQVAEPYSPPPARKTSDPDLDAIIQEFLL